MATFLGRVNLRCVLRDLRGSLDLDLFLDLGDVIVGGSASNDALIVPLETILLLGDLNAEVLLDDVTVVLINRVVLRLLLLLLLAH